MMIFNSQRRLMSSILLLISGVCSGQTGERFGTVDLDRFYSSDSIETWEAVLGSSPAGGLHYHHGFFESDPFTHNGSLDVAAADVAMETAVTSMMRYFPQNASVLDVGCGWCGPLMMMKSKGFSVTGVTINSEQARYCRSLGADVFLGDIADVELSQSYDVALLLESFSEIVNRETVLNKLQKHADTLVMRVNTKPEDSNNEGTVFGGSMHLLSDTELHSTINANGWSVASWNNVRSLTLPTRRVSKSRLETFLSTNQKKVEELSESGPMRLWNSVLNGSLSGAKFNEWQNTHGLIDVVAVKHADVEELHLSAFDVDTTALEQEQPCVRKNIAAVQEQLRALDNATQMRALTPLKLSDSRLFRFEDTYKCVSKIIAESVDIQDCERPASFWESLLLLSTKFSHSNGVTSVNSNRYSVAIPTTHLTKTRVDRIVQECLIDSLQMPLEVLDLIPLANAQIHLVVGISWPTVGSTDEAPNARLYFSVDDEALIQSFEWAIGSDSFRPREYTKIDDCEHVDDAANPLVFAKYLPTPKYCWLCHRPSHTDTFKTDLKFASPISFDQLSTSLVLPPHMLTLSNPLLTHLHSAGISIVAISNTSVALYHQAQLQSQSKSSTHDQTSSRKQRSMAMSMSGAGVKVGVKPTKRCEVEDIVEALPSFVSNVSPALSSVAPFGPSMDANTFMNTVYGKTVASWPLAHQSQSQSVAEMLGLDDVTIQQLLAKSFHHLGNGKYISLKRDGANVEDETQEFGSADDIWKMVSRSELSNNSATTAGLSVVLKGIHKDVDDLSPLSALKKRVETMLQLPIGINMYVSSPQAVALEPHTDPYDVLVIAIGGEKQWRVCESVDLPLPCSGEHPLTVADAAEFSEISRKNPSGCSIFKRDKVKSELRCNTTTLRSGDVLYLPKGVVHSAIATTMTVHITLSLNRQGLTWADGFANVVQGIDSEAAANTIRKMSQERLGGATFNRPYPTHIANTNTHDDTTTDNQVILQRHFNRLKTQLGWVLVHNDNDNTWSPEAAKSVRTLSFSQLKAYFNGTLHSKLAAAAATSVVGADGNNHNDDGADDGDGGNGACSVDQAISRSRRGACNLGAQFQCPQGAAKNYVYKDGYNCDGTCKTVQAGCDCDGVYNSGCDCDNNYRTCTTDCDSFKTCEKDCSCGCNTNYFLSGCSTTSAGSCNLCSSCSTNKYRSSGCSGRANSVCSTCSNIACSTGSYRTGVCSGTTNGFTCHACANNPCSAGSFQTGTCSGTTNGFSCHACSNSACSAGSYRKGVCSGRTNGYSCSTCANQKCSTGQYQTGACSGTTNGFLCPTCSYLTCPSTHWRSGNCGGRENGYACNKLTPCTALGVDQYEFKPPTKTSDRLCNNIHTCLSTEYEATPPTKTSGRICVSHDGSCSSSEYESVPATSSTNRQCADVGPPCGGHVNSYETAAPTKTSDRVCTACKNLACNPNQYQDGACDGSVAGGGLTCQTCANTTCSTGTYRTGACTGRHNGYICLPCTDLTCKPYEQRSGTCGGVVNDYECDIFQGTCDNGALIDILDRRQDDHCGSCNTGFYLSNRKCVPCSNVNCDSNQYRSGTCALSENGYKCNACSNIDCGGNKYRVGKCELTTDGFTCNAVKTGCDKGTYVSADPTPTTDRVCSPCQQDFQPNDNSKASKCTEYKTCSYGQFVSKLGTTSTDLECATCAPGTFATSESTQSVICPFNTTDCPPSSYVTAEPTPSSNRRCGSCKLCALCQNGTQPQNETQLQNGTQLPACVLKSDFQTCNGTYTSVYNAPECNESTLCEPGSYETNAPNPTSDRTCETCPAGSFVNSSHSNGTCGFTWFVCGVSEIELVAPTSSTDRVCKLVTSSPTTSPTTSPASPGKRVQDVLAGSGDWSPLWGGAAAFLLIVLVVAWMVTRLRKKKEKEDVPEHEQQSFVNPIYDMGPPDNPTMNASSNDISGYADVLANDSTHGVTTPQPPGATSDGNTEYNYFVNTDRATDYMEVDNNGQADPGYMTVDANDVNNDTDDITTDDERDNDNANDTNNTDGNKASEDFDGFDEV